MISGKFLQSNEWEDFQKSLGRKTWKINEALIIKMPLIFGLSYLYSPKGPEKITEKFLDRVKKIAKKEKAVFLRIEPAQKPNKKFIQTKNIQPRCTQILELTKSEEKLLEEMKQKTRYNIKLARKKGVQVRQRTTDNRQRLFYRLLEQTSEKQVIRIHSKEYYRKLAEFNEIFVATYQDKPIAGAMVNFYENTATYLHGGSSQKHKNVMAPYLLHWEIIKYAKEKRMKNYDWWGVDEKKWPGITRFKKGFGGREICAPGTYDLPLDKFWYLWYKLIRR